MWAFIVSEVIKYIYAETLKRPPMSFKVQKTVGPNRLIKRD